MLHSQIIKLAQEISKLLLCFFLFPFIFPKFLLHQFSSLLPFGQAHNLHFNEKALAMVSLLQQRVMLPELITLSQSSWQVVMGFWFAVSDCSPPTRPKYRRIKAVKYFDISFIICVKHSNEPSSQFFFFKRDFLFTLR